MLDWESPEERTDRLAEERIERVDGWRSIPEQLEEKRKYGRYGPDIDDVRRMPVPRRRDRP